MSSKLKKQKYISAVVILLFLISVKGYGQNDEDKLRLSLGFGGSHALESGFAEGYSAKGFNIPALNLGAQYMFTEKLGAKLDLGYSRIRGDEDDFKINYTRINVQGVYDYSNLLSLNEKQRLSLKVHTGPGFTFVRPLGGINGSDDSYFNLMLGTEMHYAFNRSTSVYFDVSYIHGFTDLPDYAGIGAFNGSMITFTIGVSLSLSGCYFCN